MGLSLVGPASADQDPAFCSLFNPKETLGPECKETRSGSSGHTST